MRIIFALLLLSLVACQQANPGLEDELRQTKDKLAAAEKALSDAQTDDATFIHTVFFWVKKDAPADLKASFEEGMKELAKTPSIYKLYYGPPAMTPREVVDNSYDYAWICHFKNKADHDAYQEDPIHLKFVDQYKDLWEKVQIYDNLVSNQ
ncbi:MAG: Dabb family protein [Bacteroidota bacterium]